MAATITSSGTWSALVTGNTSAVPGAVVNDTIVTHRDTVEQRGESLDLQGKASLEGGLGGFSEVNQFVGLFADGYDISGRAAIFRIRDILKSMIGTEHAEDARVYVP